MKDGLICGVIIGMLAGAILYKYNPQVKEIVNKTEDAVKTQMNDMSKNIGKKSSSKKSN